MNWHVNIMTLFPEMFPGSLGMSLSGKALEKDIWSYSIHNIRDYGHGTHKAVDDTPFGGGAGMILRADVLEQSFLSIPKPGQCYYLSPRGTPLTQQKAENFIRTPSITLLCGRYEGVDQRFLEAYDFVEISIGDYVLSGGEPAALILMDACIRLLPGVMGNDETAANESFSNDKNGYLEHPHYTRPALWETRDGRPFETPEVLTSGHHKNIQNWQKAQSYEITKRVRPDLIQKNAEED